MNPTDNDWSQLVANIDRALARVEQSIAEQNEHFRRVLDANGIETEDLRHILEFCPIRQVRTREAVFRCGIRV